MTTTYYTITGNWGDILRGKGEEKVYDHTNNTVKTVKFDYTNKGEIANLTNKGEFVNITNLKTVRLYGAGGRSITPKASLPHHKATNIRRGKGDRL